LSILLEQKPAKLKGSYMKQIVILLCFFISQLMAHECKYELDLQIDLDSSTLKGTAQIYTSRDDSKPLVLLHSDAKITAFKNATLSIDNGISKLSDDDKNLPITLDFTLPIKPIKETIFLTSSWYPLIEHPCSYRVSIKKIPDMTFITESTATTHTQDKIIFEFKHEVSSIHLIASSRYKTKELVRKDGLTIKSVFYGNKDALATRYLQKSSDYFDRYKKIFGSLAFDQFSIVEAPFPVGFAMPTFTLIGTQIIDKEFMFKSSLGHEIVHQWLGNSVHAMRPGNWSEGLSTYYADYQYAADRGEARAYRKDILLKYNTFVDTTNDRALIEFVQKSDTASEAIGYGKAMFFFYMLEQRIGKKAFDKAVKELVGNYTDRVVGYKMMRNLFEKSSSQDLYDFFKTWVYLRGAFAFDMTNLELGYEIDSYYVSFDTIGSSMLKSLPVKFCKKSSCVTKMIDLTKTSHKVQLDEAPDRIVIDDEYKIFRKLQPQEIRATIGTVFQKDTIAVVDPADRAKFANILKNFKQIRDSDKITYKEASSSNLLLLGANNNFLRQLAIKYVLDERGSKVEAFKNPLNISKSIVVIDSNSTLQAYKLKHLHRYSTVIFQDHKVLHKSIKPSQNGVVFKIDSGSKATLPTTLELDDILPDLSKSKVVYIGENHTEFSNHINQLEIIKAMYNTHKRLAIGLEMFQQPFQSILDAYVSSKIDEREMLQQTEYFKRWQYDYNLYKPILLYAREHKIPLVALNIDRNITSTISKSSLDGLNAEQKSLLPDSIEFVSKAYRDKLFKIYGAHTNSKFGSFDDFFYAQLIWDESMASKVASYLHENPDSAMAVLAGNGHVMHGYGIPDRAKRRGIKEYKIVAQSISISDSVADYILYPSPIKTKEAKKLGVMLDTSSDKLKIIKVFADSSGAKAGLRHGDTIVSIDDRAISKLHELKEVLYFTSKELNLTILRDSKSIDLNLSW